jgi:hypothetical protein
MPFSLLADQPFPFSLSSWLEFIPSKHPGPGPEAPTWGHTVQGKSMNWQDPLHVLGHGQRRTPRSLPLSALYDHSHVQGLLPCVVPCGLVPCPTRAEYLPLPCFSPLLRWRVRIQARSSSFPTPKPISLQHPTARLGRPAALARTEQPMPAIQIPERLPKATGSQQIASGIISSIDKIASSK